MFFLLPKCRVESLLDIYCTMCEWCVWPVCVLPIALQYKCSNQIKAKGLKMTVPCHCVQRRCRQRTGNSQRAATHSGWHRRRSASEYSSSACTSLCGDDRKQVNQKFVEQAFCYLTQYNEWNGSVLSTFGRRWLNYSKLIMVKPQPLMKNFSRKTLNLHTLEGND